jgi:DegV family protein with EDD domain
VTDSRKVTVVTDSAGDLPEILRNEYGIVEVPLTITFGQESFEDGVDISPAQFLQRMQASNDLPKTSQPASAKFAAAFSQEIDRGNDVVCVTITSELSGTYNAARIAAEGFSGRVRVVDSRAVSMQSGWVAVAAARAAAEGDDIDAVEKRAEGAVDNATLFAMLQSLDYVYKGGRIGRASHMVGSALGIKPILGIVDGVVTPIERVRTWKRALGRAVDLTANLGNLTDIAVLHADNLGDANATAETLRKHFPNANIVVDWAGSTIMTYSGPGAIGIMTLGAR